MRVLAFALASLLAGCAHAEASAVAPPGMKKPPPATKVGDKVAPFTGKDVMSGATIGLVPGKVNLVWFWATWSIDNVAMPHIAKLARTYESQGLNVVLVSVDDEARDIPEFLRHYGGRDLHTIWDQGHLLANDYFQVPCSPTFYIIDRNGIVHEQVCGFHDGEVENHIEPECKKLL